MTTYARIERRQLYLNTRIGVAFVEAHLGLNQEIIEGIAGRYVRGKRKGQLRGAVAFEVAVRGGWVRESGYGHVQYPGIISNSVRIVDAFTGEELARRLA